MSTYPIGSAGYSNTYAALQAANEEKVLKEKAAEVSLENSKSGKSAMGTDIMNLLSQVPKGNDGTLSFKDVEDYREQLGTAWDVAVMADLETLGVDITKEMPMSYDPDTGKVTVAAGTKNKDIIDQYFEDNPDRVAEFYDIVQLGKLTSTADSKLSQSQMMQNLQMQTIAWWYEDNSNPQDWFSGGGLLAVQSRSASYTGLNLTV